jgi:hypothetical protein
MLMYYENMKMIITWVFTCILVLNLVWLSFLSFFFFGSLYQK